MVIAIDGPSMCYKYVGFLHELVLDKPSNIYALEAMILIKV